jgi:F-type H+-transporting ATPase subunit epsilon
MNVSVVSPEEVLFDGEATQVITRTTEGDVAFLPNHAPFLGTLTAGETRVYLLDGTVQRFEIEGGFVEVSGNAVAILVS